MQLQACCNEELMPFFFFLSVEGFQSWKVPIDNLRQHSLKIRKPGIEEVKGLICWLCVPIA